mgnify:CR=1 FL=1
MFNIIGQDKMKFITEGKSEQICCKNINYVIL